MGKKKPQSKSTTPPQKHPQQSFQQMVAEAVNTKLLNTIDQRMNYIASLIMKQQKESLEEIYCRLACIEELCIEKLNVTQDDLANKVAAFEDDAKGLKEVDESKKGDTIRFLLSTKTPEQDEFKGESKCKLVNLGSGQTYGEDIEKELIGLKKNEVKEFKYGKDKTMTGKVQMLRVSRRPEPKLPKKKEEAKNESKDA